MSFFDRKTLADAQIPAVLDLFERILNAEADNLSDEQKAKPREYLIGAWREACAAVIRPLQNVEELVQEELEARQPGAGWAIPAGEVPF